MTVDQNHDNIYAAPSGEVPDFVFDEAVAQVFPDMIRRSLPGYATILGMISVLTHEFAQVGSTCYDLGCSLGGATLAMRRSLHQPNTRILGIDNSEAMLRRCRQNIAGDVSTAPVHLVRADIRKMPIRRASVVALNFTLQFVALEERDELIRRIFAGLLPGGVLVLSEKITFDNPRQDELYVGLHHFFKRANGYSELEISQKRTALENVLAPETSSAHIRRLREAGFSRTELWFQCLNFISLLAIK